MAAVEVSKQFDKILNFSEVKTCNVAMPFK